MISHVFALGSSSRPLVFAHRGGAACGPENTLAAFDSGVAAGVDGLECDVHLSRDGIPVVIHDATLDRTTDLAGPVGERTAAELARADAAFRFGPERGFPLRGRQVGVPRLDELLGRHPDVGVIIELKEDGPALARAVAEVVRRAGAAARVCVGSFHAGALAALRRVAPEVPTSAAAPEVRWALYRSRLRWPVRGRRPYAAFQVPEMAGRVRVVTPAFVRQAHREGQTVQVWVVDEPAAITRLLDWGVDGIVSDTPAAAVAARNAWAAPGGGQTPCLHVSQGV